MLNRAIRAAMLDRNLYKQITNEPQEMFWSIAVVLIAGIALGLGVMNLDSNLSSGFSVTLVILVAASTRVTVWVYWTLIIHIVGKVLLGGAGDFRTQLRNLGFVFSPGILSMFLDVPCVWPVLFSLAILWLFPAGLVAVKETQKFDWVKTSITSILGFTIAHAVQLFLLTQIVSPPGWSPGG